MNMFICQLLTDGVENQHQSQEILEDLTDLPELEVIDETQVRSDKILQILSKCAFLSSSWSIRIDPG